MKALISSGYNILGGPKGRNILISMILMTIPEVEISVVHTICQFARCYTAGSRNISPAFEGFKKPGKSIEKVSSNPVTGAVIRKIR